MATTVADLVIKICKLLKTLKKEVVISTFNLKKDFIKEVKLELSVEILEAIHQVTNDYKSFQTEGVIHTRTWKLHMIAFREVRLIGRRRKAGVKEEKYRSGHEP